MVAVEKSDSLRGCKSWSSWCVGEEYSKATDRSSWCVGEEDSKAIDRSSWSSWCVGEDSKVADRSSWCWGRR